MDVPPNNGYEPRPEFAATAKFKGISLDPNRFVNANNTPDMPNIYLVKKDINSVCPALTIDTGKTCNLPAYNLSSTNVFFASGWAPYTIYGNKIPGVECPNYQWVRTDGTDLYCHYYVDQAQ
jgi:hypothetical protein